MLSLALFCTSLAYVIYFRILTKAGATNLLLVTFLIPIGAILLGALFLDEQLQVLHGIGLLLTGAGLGAIGARNGRIAQIGRQDGSH